MDAKEKALLRRALRAYQKTLEAELVKPSPEYFMAAYEPVYPSDAPALLRVPHALDGAVYLDDEFRTLYERELGQVKAMIEVMKD